MGEDWYRLQKKKLFGIRKKDSPKERNFQPNLSSPFKRRKAVNEKLRRGYDPNPNMFF